MSPLPWWAAWALINAVIVILWAYRYALDVRLDEESQAGGRMWVVAILVALAVLIAGGGIVAFIEITERVRRRRLRAEQLEMEQAEHGSTL